MVAARDDREVRRLEAAGVWVRVTIATLLLSAAAILAAYTMSAEPRRDLALGRFAAPDSGALATPALSTPDRVQPAAYSYAPTRSDASTAQSR